MIADPRWASTNESAEHCQKEQFHQSYLTLFSRDLLRLEDFDALIFHPLVAQVSDLPEKRGSDQFYVYYNIEAPLITATSYHGGFRAVHSSSESQMLLTLILRMP